MSDEQTRAAEYRQEAVACFEVARRISDGVNRARMTEIAQRLLQLAQNAEKEKP